MPQTRKPGWNTSPHREAQTLDGDIRLPYTQPAHQAEDRRGGQDGHKRDWDEDDQQQGDDDRDPRLDHEEIEQSLVRGRVGELQAGSRQRQEFR